MTVFAPSVIVNCPTPQAREALLEVLDVFGGIKPTNNRDTSFAQRARFENAGALTLLINTTDPKEWGRMGRPVFALTIESSNPDQTARDIMSLVDRHGFLVHIHHDPESALPPGSLHIIQTNLVPGLAFVVRKPMSMLGGPTPVPAKSS